MADVADQLVDVVKTLVDDPEQVELETEDLGGTVLLNVTVAEEELGRVIGRQGRTVRALRTLLEVRGTDSGVYYDLEVVEP
ncbi:MAG: KH domain-containing protein [Acidobacteriota bacterium]